MSNNSANNKRIAKNTVILYFRTIIILFISLYTSRVILNALGVEDFGIYNVVGGMVAMLGVLSNALSSSISRFLTFELGKGDKKRLNTIFCTSVNIQIGISVVVLIVGEILGVWFLNYYMNIPPERMTAANWVLQCSLATFCVNLMIIPYNATIIAHEKMDAFAYISIFEAVLKLVICYAIIISPYDRLIVYALLLLFTALIIRIIYGIYCSKNFEECHYKVIFNRPVLKEMAGFAGWNFFTNSAYVFNTQGVNLLINIFFGVTVNAARGIATQVEHAVMQLVNSFTTALNPQITKNYACGNKEAMVSLVCRGAKFSYFLMFIFALPVLIETEYILSLWLKIVPPHAVNFVRLAIIASMINIVGKTGYTACMATGNIKKYVLWITPITCLVFPLSWIAFEFGGASEMPYIIYAFVYIVNELVRLRMMKELLDFPVLLFVKKVIGKVAVVTVASVSLSLLIPILMEPCVGRMIFSTVVSLSTAIVMVLLLGLTRVERHIVIEYVNKKIKDS